MHESLKAMKRRQRDPLFTSRYFVGEGIDIGCGPDPLGNQRLWGAWPLMHECDGWDLELGDGDAQLMEGEEDETYDFVYSSHTLEHVVDPVETLRNWWRILKPGGHLVIAVPDEDMYEQGVWPPTFNTDHKHTYAVGKRASWSPVSRNIDELLRELDGEIIKIERVEECFVRDTKHRVDQTSMGLAESCIECIVRKPFPKLKAVE
jgi:SAM-dependent methyltransferase